jgi:hypothetical protein
MPINFPDFESIIKRGRMWKFRAPFDLETEREYREALADFVQSRDLVESYEIRSGVGWDRWDAEQERDMVTRAFSGGKEGLET